MNSATPPPRAPVRPEMLRADYWLARAGDAERSIVSETSLEALNRAIASRCSEMVSLCEIEKSCTGGWVRQRIERYALPYGQLRYDAKGAEWTGARYQELERARNLEGVAENSVIRRGVVTKKVLMRGFPSMELLTKERGDQVFDRLQEGEFDVAEPLLLLHESLDKRWWFVQTRNYAGWVLRDSVAEVKNASDWERLINPNRFVVCTASTATLRYENEEDVVTVMMGTRLPLVSEEKDWTRVWAPRRGAAGEAIFAKCYLDATQNFSMGYLPPTRRNLFTQIFKMLGEPYSWGGLVEGGRDCTRLLLDTYRTFGIFLPRNSSQQKEIGVETLDVTRHVEEPNAVWSEAIAGLEPGTPVYSDGHAMLYLGSEGNYHYIIHSASRLQNLPTPGVANRFGVVVSGASDLRDGLASIRWARRL